MNETDKFLRLYSLPKIHDVSPTCRRLEYRITFLLNTARVNIRGTIFDPTYKAVAGQFVRGSVTGISAWLPGEDTLPDATILLKNPFLNGSLEQLIGVDNAILVVKSHVFAAATDGSGVAIRRPLLKFWQEPVNKYIEKLLAQVNTDLLPRLPLPATPDENPIFLYEDPKELH